MTLRHVWLFPLLVIGGVAYAWWTQPFVGPASTTSVIARSLVLTAWFAVFLIIDIAGHRPWSWRHFLAGAVSGGGWLVLLFPMGDTLVKSLAIVAMGAMLGMISGLYAAMASTTPRAVLTGIAMFIAQLAVGILVHGLGWSKYSYGM